VDIAGADLTKPVVIQLAPPPGIITGANEWNKATNDLVGDTAGIFSSLDHGDQYLNTFRQKLSARIEEGEKKLKSLESAIRAVRSVLSNAANTSISISGGDTSWVDQNSKYYVNAPQLKFVPEEGCYRLPDTGFFSSIRSNGFMGGSAVLEKTLTPLEQVGDLTSITDGSGETYWLASSYLPALVRASTGDVAWLPSQYTHGSAVLLSYYMDRPTLAGEIFIDPISTEPFNLLSISWTPRTIANALINPTFAASGSWSYLQGASYVASGATAAHASLPAASGMIAQTFDLTTALNTSLSGSVAATGVSVGQRVELVYTAKTIGECLTAARVSWYSAGGTEISFDQKVESLPSIYKSNRLVSYAPTSAVSGKVSFFVYGATMAATSCISAANLYVGEQKWVCNQKVDKPTTISLPTSVTSSRFSFVLTQTSPRRESYVNKAGSDDVTRFVLPDYIESSLVKSINSAIEAANSIGPGQTVFSYKFGLKELDLRYREYVPRASLTSIPLNTRKEVRSIWVSSDVDNLYTTGLGFYIIPYDKDDTYKIPVRPYKVGAADSSGETVQSQGDILSIFTQEEVDAGWADNAGLKIVTEPTKFKQVIAGTDRDGKITLAHVPHLRRVQVRAANDWLSTRSIWPSSFDPNAETLTGIEDTTILAKIRSSQAVDVTQDDIVTTKGYLPLKITVATERWTATQDTFGKPDSVTLRSVEGEILSAADVVLTSTSTDAEYISYSQYLATTLLSQFLDRNPTTVGGLALNSSTIKGTSFEFKSLRETIDILKSASQNTTGSFANNTLTGISGALGNALTKTANVGTLTSTLETVADQEYQRFKANRTLTKTQDITTTKTTTIPGLTAYRTKYAPIVKGEVGSLFKLYWATTNKKIPISPNNYKINSITGVIELKESKPAGYDQLMADYKYVNKTDESSFFSQSLSLINTAANGEDVAIGSKEFPICRNMTDYVTGKVPTLKRPNFDPLSTDYYPIIEFYVTADGQIQFSRDFHPYGDMPATITIEGETLGVQPRVEMTAVRASGANTSPRAFGISLRTREGVSSPSREVKI
jgi:hypothetical protein